MILDEPVRGRTPPPWFHALTGIDRDTHVLEPADLWTSWLPSTWQERAPQVVQVGEKQIWVKDGKGIGAPALASR